MGKEEKVRVLGGALICCLRQQLFDASVVDQVFRLEQDIFVICDVNRKRSDGIDECGEVRLKITEGVMNQIVRFGTYAICIPRKGECAFRKLYFPGQLY
jgi:hypothetical protein